MRRINAIRKSQSGTCLLENLIIVALIVLVSLSTVNKFSADVNKTFYSTCLAVAQGGGTDSTVSGDDTISDEDDPCKPKRKRCVFAKYGRCLRWE